MALPSGARLGPYEIVAPLGAGGMGEVYRARDTRLDRTVAIKVLPPQLAADPVFRERFDREAHAIAALSHPHICALYDVGDAPDPQLSRGATGTVRFLVMEFVEGETLAARLAKGPLPLDQVLRCAIEVADALDRAHRAGIVHRDLKPANIMLTKAGVKLLDFGIARLGAGRAREAGGESVRPTEAPLTGAGVILGTPNYLAPEQLQGQDVDARTDIFALGAVVYETATGKKAFEGANLASVIAAVLDHAPPPIGATHPLTPPALDHVVQVCLAKDPDDRWQSVSDVMRELKWITDDVRQNLPAASEPSGAVPAAAATATRAGLVRASSAVAAALLLTGGGAALTWAVVSPHWSREPPGSIQRTSVSLGKWGVTDIEDLAISPDGQTLAIAARSAGETRLYVRRLDDWEPRLLAGTEGATHPFFSDDGEWIAFATVMSTGLQKVPVRGGPPQPICGNRQPLGGTWGPDGQIVFGAWGGMWRVSAEGGTPEPLVNDPESGSVRYLEPQVLPGGEAVIFTTVRDGHPSIRALTLRTGEIQTIVDPGNSARYVPTGHLIYESEEHLYAVAFDPARLEVRGPSRIVVDDVGVTISGNATFDSAPAGRLAYVPASARLKRLVFMDRHGGTAPLSVEPGHYFFPALSPDGRQLVVTTQEGAARKLWVGSTEGGPLTQIAAGSDDMFGLFTPDGKRISLTSMQNGRYGVFWTPTDGSGKLELLVAGMRKATAWSADGKLVLLNDMESGTLDIFQMEIGRSSSMDPVVTTRFSELDAKFSPDGRWVAYASNETGRYEVYVQAYPGPGVRRQVSAGGGQTPVWNPRGGELFYQSPTDVMSVRSSRDVPVGNPTTLFSHTRATGLARDWDVGPDGQRFLVLEAVEGRGSRAMVNVVSNWLDPLNAKPSRP